MPNPQTKSLVLFLNGYSGMYDILVFRGPTIEGQPVHYVEKEDGTTVWVQPGESVSFVESTFFKEKEEDEAKEEQRLAALQRMLFVGSADDTDEEEDEDGEKDFSEILDEFTSDMRFEGDIGLESMEKVCKALGYAGHQFRWGSPLEHFLSDNPGCIEAMLDWIREQGERTPEWREGIESELTEETEDDDSDEWVGGEVKMNFPEPKTAE